MPLGRFGIVSAWLILFGCVSLCRDVCAASDEQPDGQKKDFFAREVLPILKTHCFKCHVDEAKGGLQISSREALLKGGDTGPALVPTEPDKSLLIAALNYADYEMPPDGKLPQEKIEIITRWVRDGALWSSDVKVDVQATQHGGDPQINETTKNHWAFQGVKRPAVPQVESTSWVRNPIDAFVLARLESQGLSPAPPAGKGALLRRAYYDLIGLPPTPAEVDAFLADDSPQAFERVVDRLLDSPHYGEKWARHWLDLVRYAETNSYERDGAKPFVWRYRDYVIRSLNEDKPYDDFVREQLAGDELQDATSDSIIATGYFRLGIWQDEPVSQAKALYDDLDDIVATTAQAFLGLTVNCARCHDHKLDPIPQEDYYRMLAFFRNVRRYGVRSHQSVMDASVRTIGASEKVRAHQQKLKRIETDLSTLEQLIWDDLTGIERDEFQTEAARIGIVQKRVGTLLGEDQVRRYAQLTRRRDALRKMELPSAIQVLCVKEHGVQSPPTHVLVRGNHDVRGNAVEPGFPQVLSSSDPVIEPVSSANSSGRRLALANWIASEENPLAARVMVNRIWQHHFGRGIVRSPNDFGLQGRSPTHPQLLDWLAVEFVQSGWRLKRLHKLIMMSAAYQMSSRTNGQALAKDPRNDFFWRFDMRRLTAEEIRDSILAVNGSLNLDEMFGPGIYTVMPKEVLAGQSRPGHGWGESSPEDQARRSIYIHVKRSLIPPELAAFDVADTDFTCPVRFTSTQPTQALGMLNSDFINEQARVFADYLRSEAGDDPADQVRLALKRTCQREPTVKEVRRGVRLLQTMTDNVGVDPQESLKYFCLLTLNLNEFIYLD